MTLTKAEILDAVKDSEWQAFRAGLHGLTTVQKLVQLERWKQHRPGRRSQVQVENYHNALKRGGQLSVSGEVLR